MIELTAPALRQILPKAPQGVIEAFASPEGQQALFKAGINHTRTRLAIALAQVEHETDGFSIKDLTENTNYTAERAVQIWSSRLKSATTVRAKYGTGPGWQLKMFDDVYGGRMGNRTGTRDGSTYIGRGGPQITGRDGYREVGKRIGVDLVAEPKAACRHDLQPAVLAGFWTWKNLNPVADVGGLKAVTKPWNGGYIGMADREARLAGNDPIIKRLKTVEAIMPQVKDLPGSPPTPSPPKDVINAATDKERKARKGGAGVAGAGGGNEVAKTAADAPQKPVAPPEAGGQPSTEQPGQLPLLPAPVAYGLIAVGVVVVVVATIIIARKKRAVIANWF